MPDSGLPDSGTIERPAERPFDADPTKSFTVPARFYSEPGIFACEKDAIFYRNWWLAGHVSKLAEPGCYITTRIHDQNIVILRGRDGALRAFFNVCQHRGHELLSGEGQVPIITCPYHAWAYGLDGKLRSARGTEAMADFDPESFCLKTLAVEVLGGLVFVKIAPGGRGLADLTGPLGDELRRFCPRIDELVFAHRHSYDVACNWKVLADNFLECYHCAPAHKDFVDLVDMETYSIKLHEIHSAQISRRVRSSANSAYRLEEGQATFGYAGWFLWPNLTIWMMPGEPNLMTLQIIPVGPERSIEYLDWYLLSPEPSAQMQEAMVYMDEVLQPEDIGLCESVQRGLHSLGYNQGRFVCAPDDRGESEHAVHHFQNLVMQAMDRG